MLSPTEVASLYDAHARSVYGASLLVSRHRRDARKALLLTFCDFARRTQEAGSRARLDLLQIALGWAYQFSTTHLHLFRCRHSAAVTTGIGVELDALTAGEALRRALVEFEGVTPEEVPTALDQAPSNRMDGRRLPDQCERAS